MDEERTAVTRDEVSTLLYLETCAVDLCGRVDARRMNAADFEIVKRWNEIGFILFGRICARDVGTQGAYWCHLSDRAFEEAHRERRARADRGWSARRYETTEEHHAPDGAE